MNMKFHHQDTVYLILIVIKSLSSFLHMNILLHLLIYGLYRQWQHGHLSNDGCPKNCFHHQNIMINMAWKRLFVCLFVCLFFIGIYLFVKQSEQNSDICRIGSMRYANETLHVLARHEYQWCLHLFTLNINEKHRILVPQRRIDIDLAHLRYSGENFQMEILPGEQGWLFAVRRAYLLHLNYNGKDGNRLICLSKKKIF